MGTYAKLIDISGHRFGRLTVLSRADDYKNGSAQWRCQCDCGAQCIVIGQKMRNGRAVSCGCFNRDAATARLTTHGESGTRLFRIWSGMKTRCYNAKSNIWKRYGARGISICDEWLDNFAAFGEWAKAHGYADHLTIERVDNNGPYSPGNCRWAPHSEQGLNKSNTSRLKDGRRALDVARENGVAPQTFMKRRRHGMSVDVAAMVPNQRPRHRLADGRAASDVALANGIARDTFNQRVRLYGWSVEDACTVPVRGKG